MPTLDKEDSRKLKRFVNGGIVRKEDERLINRLARTGIVRLGFTDKEGEPIRTAKLTDTGKSILKRNSVIHSPLYNSITHLLDRLANLYS